MYDANDINNRAFSDEPISHASQLSVAPVKEMRTAPVSIGINHTERELAILGNRPMPNSVTSNGRKVGQEKSNQTRSAFPSLFRLKRHSVTQMGVQPCSLQALGTSNSFLPDEYDAVPYNSQSMSNPTARRAYAENDYCPPSHQQNATYCKSSGYTSRPTPTYWGCDSYQQSKRPQSSQTFGNSTPRPPSYHNYEPYRQPQPPPPSAYYKPARPPIPPMSGYSSPMYNQQSSQPTPYPHKQHTYNIPPSPSGSYYGSNGAAYTQNPTEQHYAPHQTYARPNPTSSPPIQYGAPDMHYPPSFLETEAMKTNYTFKNSAARERLLGERFPTSEDDDGKMPAKRISTASIPDRRLTEQLNDLNKHVDGRRRMKRVESVPNSHLINSFTHGIPRPSETIGSRPNVANGTFNGEPRRSEFGTTSSIGSLSAQELALHQSLFPTSNKFGSRLLQVFLRGRPLNSGSGLLRRRRNEVNFRA